MSEGEQMLPKELYFKTDCNGWILLLERYDQRKSYLEYLEVITNKPFSRFR